MGAVSESWSLLDLSMKENFMAFVPKCLLAIRKHTDHRRCRRRLLPCGMTLNNFPIGI